MAIYKVPRIKDAELLPNGVCIRFDGGRIACYSASLLYAMLDEAEEIFYEFDNRVSCSLSNGIPASREWS